MRIFAYVVGAFTQIIKPKQLQGYNFNRCFIACAGVDIEQNASYSTEIETRDLKKLACQKSRSRYLLVDQSKIGVIGFCALEPLSNFDLVICDEKKDLLDYPANFRFALDVLRDKHSDSNDNTPAD